MVTNEKPASRVRLPKARASRTVANGVKRRANSAKVTNGAGRTSRRVASGGGKQDGAKVAPNGPRKAAQLSKLQRITSDLLAAMSQRDVARVLIERAGPAWGAQIASVVMLDESGDHCNILAISGLPDDLMNERLSFPLDPQTPYSDAIQSGRPIILENRQQRDKRYPQFASDNADFGEAWVAFPLTLHGRPTGGIGFSFRDERHFSQDDVDLLLLLADHTALALERGRLYEEQQAAHEKLNRRYAELSALYELMDGAVRAASLDEIYEQALIGLQHATGADRTALLLFDDGGTMRFVASRGLSKRYRDAVEGHSPWSPDSKDPAPLLVPDVLTDESLAGLRAVISNEGIGALSFVPLVYHGRLLGKCMLYYNQPHLFTEEEVQIAVTIANKAATGIQHKKAEDAVRESERRYRELLGAVGVAVYTTDAQGRITLYNDAAAELWGRRPALGEDEWCGSWRLFWPDGTPMRHDECPMAVTLKEDRPVRGTEAIAERPDGSRVAFLPLPTPLHDAAGKLTGAVNVMVDITDRRRMEEALRDSEQRYRGLVSTVPGVVWEAWGEPDASSQRIDFVSDYVEEMLGYTVEEWVTAPNFWLTIVHPDDKERAAATAKATFESGRPGHNQFRWIARDGRVLTVDAHSIVITDEHGKPVGMRGVTIDVTERKHAEERFSRAFQASPAAISITRGSDRVILDINDSFCEVFGYTREELVGKPVTEIGLWASEADRERFAKAVGEHGSVRNMEVAIRDRNGELKLALGSAEVIDVAGEVCVLALFYDITERKRAEQRLAEAAARTQAILDTAVDGVVTIDDSGTIESVNPAVSRLLGYAAEELVGQNVRILMPAPYHDEHPRYLEHYLRTGERRIIGSSRELEGRRKDGSTFPMQLSVSEVVLDDRRLFTGIIHDLTERKRAEQRLEFLAEASERLSSSLDIKTVLAEFAQLAIGSVCDWCSVDMLDEDGNLQRIKLAHHDTDKVQLIEEMNVRYPPDPEAPRGIYQVLRTGNTDFYPEVPDEMLVELTQDEKHLRFARSLALGSVIIAPLVVRDKILGAITLATAASGRRYTVEDVSMAEELARRAAFAVENARLYTASQAVQEELRRVNEAKDEFLGVISHELRTPVTVIYGAANLLNGRSSTIDEASRLEVMGDIEREASRLRRLVEDMMVLARMELTAPNSTWEPIQIRHLISHVLGDIRARHPSCRTRLHVKRDIPPIAGDPTYVEQIVRNLVQNAIKYAPSDEPIDITARRSGENEVVVSVMDRGPGLETEELEAIFERFYRSDRTKAMAGVGMGLTVCKRLVEAQSGKIWAEHRDGGGLMISFSLPIYSEDAG